VEQVFEGYERPNLHRALEGLVRETHRLLGANVQGAQA
jgi:hypothetical protein